ncbi:hypothetical protein CU097_005386 [Rhizopus azygosporus]|uniref:Transcription factor domain-containing protein n=1 Tax=Rhizopus azygosporus TaxID=86630 RepID=A0A367J233_RHIAZ|nr:hypothetical protein CU097_005386 [Rhizopus azygosporus]
MKLIHFFFQSNPHCILINKTRLLERYWKDSAEPLLLSVIYGTTISVGQHILEGKPFTLHQCTAKRNPFLDYAYILYEQVYASRQISLGNYQAIVLLSLYEISLGYSKHGMTMLSLSYMIAAELGVFDDQGMCASMDLIDREQLVTTYWTAFSATSHGCLELGFHVRERLLFHKQPFPPATASTSASYQYDLINNNHGPTTRAYFIESFHVGMVINYFSSKIAICLPTTKDNVFGLSVTKSDRNLALSLFHHDDEGTIKYKIQLVLNDFSIFIEQEKHQWTPRQLFMIETTHQLYRIHFNFIKSKNTGLQLETVKELDLNDQNIVRLLQCALPISYTLTHNLDQFIQQSCQVESEEMLDMLPIGLMAITLETVAQIFIYNYLLSNEQEKVLDHLNRAYCISKKSIWRHWTPMRSIQKMLKDFLKNKPSDIFQKHFTVHEPTDDITCFLFTDDERASLPEIEATFLNDINSYFQNMFASENTSLYF